MQGLPPLIQSSSLSIDPIIIENRSLDMRDPQENLVSTFLQQNENPTLNFSENFENSSKALNIFQNNENSDQTLNTSEHNEDSSQTLNISENNANNWNSSKK